MPRRYRNYRRSVKAVKYSNETFSQFVPNTVAAADWNNTIPLCMVPSADAAGMRKAKNFTLSMQYAGFEVPVQFVLVYVPEGLHPSQLSRATWSEQSTDPVSLYEPNQNVIIQGILPTECNGRQEFRTRLARNLNSGDSIYLVLRTVIDVSTSPAFCAQLNFAISF